MRRHFFLIAALITGVGIAFAGPGKKALKLIEKQKFEQAEKVLRKGLEKDTLAPAVHYAYAAFFFDSANAKVHLDSAYYHILKAESQIPFLEPKDRGKLSKIPADSVAVAYLKDKIDSAAFLRASAAHTEDAYQAFFLTHTDANQRPEAEKRRNEIAFAEATAINTYESYRGFMEKYPDAPQVKEADKLYEIRLYEEATRDKQLNQYLAFIKRYPTSPYLEDARRNVFQLSTLAGKAEQFAKIASDYPGSEWGDISAAYYTYLRKAPPIVLRASVTDSLRAVIARDTLPLITVRKGGYYHFYLSNGKSVDLNGIEGVPVEYLCGAHISAAILAFNEDGGALYNRLGHLVQKDVEEAEPLIAGLSLYRRGEYYGVVHISGMQVLPPLYDRIELEGTFLLTSRRDRKALYSLAGRQILHETYEAIQVEGRKIIARTGGKTLVYFIRDLLPLAEGREVSPLSIQNGRTYSGDTYLAQDLQGFSSLYNAEGEVLIPATQGRIYPLDTMWVVEEEQMFTLHGADGQGMYSAPADSLLMNANWLAARTDSGWFAYYVKVPPADSLFRSGPYDSLALLGTYALKTYDGSGHHLMLHPSQPIAVQAREEIKVLIPQSAMRGLEPPKGFFVQVEGSRGRSRVFNSAGKLIAEGLISQAEALTDTLISLRKGRRFALLSAAGRELLPARYDGLTLQHPAVAILKNKRFGVYLPSLDKEIDARYERLLKPLDGYLYTARKGGKAGIVDPLRGELTPFAFDDIRAFNDSLFLGKTGQAWNLYSKEGAAPVYREMRVVRPFGQTKDEQRFLVMADNQYGLLSTTQGEILKPAFDEIVNVGTNKHPVYFAEKEVEEAGVSVVVWYDEKGRILFRETYPEDELDLIYCD